MPHDNSVFHQMTKLIDWSVFARLVDTYSGDYRVRRLRMKDQFLALLYGQFSGSKSLREITQGLESHSPGLYHLGLRNVKRSSLCDANARRPCQVYHDLFQHFLASLTTAGRRGLKDVTRIALPASTQSWAKASKDKPAIKLHIVFEPEQELPLLASMTSTLVNDITVARAIDLEPGATYLFDLAYYSFDWWAKMHDLGCRFVTRLKHNTRLEMVETLPCPEDTNILFDGIARLSKRAGKRSKNPMRAPIRMIKIKLETGKVITLASNDIHSPAEVITDLYKTRWQIELFFKWIKQNLKIKHFLGTSPNAVWTQILVALIAYILITKLKKVAAIKQSKTTIARIVRVHIMNKRPIDQIFKPPKSPDRSSGEQYELI